MVRPDHPHVIHLTYVLQCCSEYPVFQSTLLTVIRAFLILPMVAHADFYQKLKALTFQLQADIRCTTMSAGSCKQRKLVRFRPGCAANIGRFQSEQPVTCWGPTSVPALLLHAAPSAAVVDRQKMRCNIRHLHVQQVTYSGIHSDCGLVRLNMRDTS